MLGLLACNQYVNASRTQLYAEDVCMSLVTTITWPILNVHLEANHVKWSLATGMSLMAWFLVTWAV